MSDCSLGQTAAGPAGEVAATGSARTAAGNHPADAGVAAEMVAPRLWFSPNTIDAAYTSNDPKCRKYAIERSPRCIDIANYLGADLIVLWLAREGSYMREAKNGRR